MTLPALLKHFNASSHATSPEGYIVIQTPTGKRKFTQYHGGKGTPETYVEVSENTGPIAPISAVKAANREAQNKSLSDTDKIALIREVYEAAVRETESFEEARIGSELAYLLGAIATNGTVDWSSPEISDSPLRVILRRRFPSRHAVWSFIIR